jgi:hypothetical protein
VYFNACGIKQFGVLGYIKHIAPSGLPAVMVPIIWVLEVVSLLLRALTLAVRLFGNMFAGHMALGVFSLLATGFFTAAIQGAGVALGGISVAWVLFLVAMYCLEMLVPFVWVIVCTVLDVLPGWSILVIAAAKMAFDNARQALRYNKEGMKALVGVDEKTAQLQLAFSVLMFVSFITAALW